MKVSQSLKYARTADLEFISITFLVLLIAREHCQGNTSNDVVSETENCVQLVNQGLDYVSIQIG